MSGPATGPTTAPTTAPLRAVAAYAVLTTDLEIVYQRHYPAPARARVEILECGHVITPGISKDHFTFADRRRCRACHHGDAPNNAAIAHAIALNLTTPAGLTPR